MKKFLLAISCSVIVLTTSSVFAASNVCTENNIDSTVSTNQDYSFTETNLIAAEKKTTKKFSANAVSTKIKVLTSGSNVKDIQLKEAKKADLNLKK